MKPRRIWIIPLALLLLALLASGAALSHENATGVTAARMQVMKDMAARMKLLGEMLDGRTPYDPATARAAALALHHDCHAAADQFPAAGHDHHSRAAPEIWKQPERFVARMDDLRAAVGDLVAATASAPAASVAGRFAEVGRACTACHEAFRLPEP